MKKFLIVAILQLATSLSYAEEVDPNIALIQNSFEAYLKEWIARDATGLDTLLQLISSHHPAVSLIQRRISLISGSPAHCKMDTHTVRRTA